MASEVKAQATDGGEQGLVRIEEKLDILIRLLALSIVSDDESIETRALRLQRARMSSAAIAEVCDTTTDTVRVTLFAARKKGKSRKGAKKNG